MSTHQLSCDFCNSSYYGPKLVDPSRLYLTTEDEKICDECLDAQYRDDSSGPVCGCGERTRHIGHRHIKTDDEPDLVLNFYECPECRTRIEERL